MHAKSILLTLSVLALLEYSSKSNAGDTHFESERAGNDGEFYLPYGEIFELTKNEYYFTNVNLEYGAQIKISDEYTKTGEPIRIHSLGVCNLYGGFDIEVEESNINFFCEGGISSGSTRSTDPDSDERTSPKQAVVTREHRMDQCVTLCGNKLSQLRSSQSELETDPDSDERN